MAAGSFVGDSERGTATAEDSRGRRTNRGDTNRGVAKGQRLPHEELVTQDPVGGVQDRKGGAPGGIGVGEETADDPLAAALAPESQGDDHHVRVEGTNRLHAQELEPHAVLHRLGEGVDARLGGAAKFAGLGCEALGLAGEALGFQPGEQHPGTPLPGTGAVG